MASSLSTPFFLPWRARLAAARRALPRRSDSQPVLHQLQLLFAGWVPGHWLCPTEEKACSRQRDWPLRRCFWTFLAQVLCPGSACRAAVRQAQAQAGLENRPVPSEQTSAYCQARRRLPLELLQRMLQRLAGTLEQRVPSTALWCGRVVKVADGTTLTAEDTPVNQKVFAQPKSQQPGCGFPLIRLVGLFSLASGALLSWATGTYLQSELALASQLWAELDPGDVLLADRFFGCYRILAWVQSVRADAVCRLHATRSADFRCGRKRGPLDRQVLWERPYKVPPGMSASEWLGLPATLTVRLVRFQVQEKGFRTRQVTLVTTLLDAQRYPPSALAALYRRRWQVELSFRQIKSALAMDHLAVRSPEMVDRSLAMHLIAYQLIRGLMQEAALTWDIPLERMSFVGALDGCRHFGEACLRARTKKQRTALLSQLLRILAADSVPERPGRCEPRAIKRRLKAYPRLNCPRRHFQEVPHRNRRPAATFKNRQKSTV